MEPRQTKRKASQNKNCYSYKFYFELDSYAIRCIGNQKKHPLTPFFNRIAYRKGRISAITATARKLAIIIWSMITKHQPYRPFDHYHVTEKQKIKQLKNIKHRLLKLNLDSEQLKTLFLQTSSSVT